MLLLDLFRRKSSSEVALAPTLGRFQITYLGIGRQLRVAHDDAISARSDLIVGEMLDDVSEAAGWPRGGDSGFDVAMIEAMSPNADNDEVADV